MAYTPNIDGILVRTLADWGGYFDEKGIPADIIELMDEENTILDDALWREATHEDGNHTTVRNGLPQVYWRRLYRGVEVSKSSVSTIKDPVGMLEARSIIDKKLLDIHKNKAKAYREQEAKSFMEAMRQKLSTAIFYGNVKGNPDSINGLDPRYAFRNAPHVIDAGGTPDQACTSIWGVVWGAQEVTANFPKGSVAGLTHTDLGEHDAYDEEGRAFRAVSDLYEWNVGLSVSDWRSVVRICNIPVDNLQRAKGDAGFIDLQRFTIIAKNKIPQAKRNRMRWYMNEDVMTALELQATDAGNVTLIYREEDSRFAGPMFKSHEVVKLHTFPVRQNDAILSTEEALSDAPA